MKEKRTDAERRAAPRVPVGVYLHQVVDGESHRCFASDVSSTGLYMEQPMRPFARQSNQIQLEIPLDEGDPVWIGAEVVYDCFDALFHGTAVRFTAMTQRDRSRLEGWIERTGLAA